MKRLLGVCFFLLLVKVVPADQHKYFIGFADKSGSAFTTSNPSEFLSPRAIQRRLFQNISYSEQDLPVNQNYIDSVVAKGATVFTKSKWFNGITILCDSSILPDILSLPFVISSVKVFREAKPKVKKIITSGVPLNSNSELKITGEDYGMSFNQIHLMNGEAMHEEGFLGDGKLIAVLDDGFYAVDRLSPFDRLRARHNIVATWDFVSNNSSVYDDDTHGMSVLSTIAGYVPGMLIGTAPNASFLLLRSEDAATENIIEEYNWNAAAEYADSAGADLITTSLGYTEFDDSTANHVYSDMDGDHCPSSIAADIAASKGMLVVASAGNSGVSPWHFIGAPSDGDSVISVAAVDSMGRHIYFSSYGPAPDGRIKPNVAAKGYNSTLSDASGAITSGSGTSFSCPILAGAAACLWQAYSRASAMQIKMAIERSGSLYSTPNDSMGYGIPDFRTAGYFLTYGTTETPITDQLISVFPNPFSDDVSIKFYSEYAQFISIEIFNSTGQLISSQKGKTLDHTIHNFTSNSIVNASAGLYIVKVTTKDNSFVKKVLKKS